jgi:hypothetical protein
MMYRGLLLSTALLLLTSTQLLNANTLHKKGDEQNGPEESLEPLAVLAKAGLEPEELTLTIKFIKQQPYDKMYCFRNHTLDAGTCFNGGTCEKQDDSDAFSCSCPEDFYGAFCEEKEAEGEK